MSGLVPWSEDIKQVPSMSAYLPAIEIFVTVFGDHESNENLERNGS
jgi:hypothetical protein